MSKPNAMQLLDKEQYDFVPRQIAIYRRKADGNLFFITDDGQVLDKFVRVVDSGPGMAVVTRQRGFGEKLGGKILKLAVGVFTGQPGLPIAIAKELLHMSQKDVEDGRLVKDSLEKLKAGETREAVLQLVDRYGAPSIYELVSKFAADPRQFAYDALIEAVGKISDKDPETDTFG